MKKIDLNRFAPAGCKYVVIIALLIFFSSACTNQTQNQTPSQAPTPPAISSDSAGIPSLDNRFNLDLQEANVIAVSFEPLENGTYRFDVTLQHDDDGEAPNYADYWQVEDPDGMVLGKRVLTHSHSNEPFTRSEIIMIPDGITSVNVRGHDRTHGFGGQAMKVNLLSREIEAYIEGSSLE